MRHTPLLGTTEQRIVFSPVEIRNSAASSSTLRSTSKSKTPGKESSSNSKKGKKKVNVRTTGIEEVAGSLSVGVSTSVPLEQDPAPESGQTTRDGPPEAEGKAARVDEDGNMCATVEGDDAEQGVGDRTLEEDAGGEEYVGEVPTGSNAGSPGRKKQRRTRDDNDDREASAHRSSEDPAATSTAVVQPDTTQGQPQQVLPPVDDDIIMATGPALGALRVSGSQLALPQEVAPKSDDTQLPT